MKKQEIRANLNKNFLNTDGGEKKKSCLDP